MSRLQTFVLAIACDGYLVTGPMWADVGPWWMRSAANLVFGYSDSFTDFSMEFAPDGGGGHYTLSSDINGVASPLEWKKELSSEYAKCLERPRR